MNAHYVSFSATSRLLAVCAATLITSALFGVVAVGLTGENVSTLVAQRHEVPAQVAGHQDRAPASAVPEVDSTARIASAD